VELENNEPHDVDLDAKMELMEVVLHLKGDVSCQAETSPDETLLFF